MLVLYLFMLDLFFFFFNDTATTEIYTLSLHDALPISGAGRARDALGHRIARSPRRPGDGAVGRQGGRVSGSRLDLPTRSEEHTSELQSQSNLVCRLLLEKKKKTNTRRLLTTNSATSTL